MPTLKPDSGSDLQLKTPDRRLRVFRALAACVLLTGLAGIVGLAATSQTVAACRTCHQNAAAAVVDSAHSQISCVTCHSGYRSFAGVVGGGHILQGAILPGEAARSAIGRVEDEACMGCHSAEEILAVVESRGVLMSHVGLADAGYVCVDCHEALVHDIPDGKLAVPTMGMCMECHDGATAPATCDACHPARTADDVDRLRDAEWAQTHGSAWEQRHGLGDLATCSACHTADECVTCHGLVLPHPVDFGVLHGRQAAELGQSTCRMCHTDSFCASCHGIDMPHPSGFLAEHAGVARNRTDARCLVCHTSANCNECHERHTHPGAKHRRRPPTGMYKDVQ